MMAVMLLFLLQHKGTFALHGGENGKFIAVCMQKLQSQIFHLTQVSDTHILYILEDLKGLTIFKSGHGAYALEFSKY